MGQVGNGQVDHEDDGFGLLAITHKKKPSKKKQVSCKYDYRVILSSLSNQREVTKVQKAS